MSRACVVVAAAMLLSRGVVLAESPKSDLESLHKKATAKGKYKMLLRQISVPEDEKKVGAFHDDGKQNRTTYSGRKDLPAGYWVYAAPYWYIWRDRTSDVQPKRNWGPEQVCGKPNTPNAGDAVTAWASQTQDGADEWLMCEYGEFTTPASVVVYETYMPGAVSRITAFRLDGTEVDVWKGKDPTPTNSASGISIFPVKMKFKTNRIKVYIDSKRVPGWNEVDAIGLRDEKKKTIWAVSADASTTYAVQTRAVPVFNPAQKIQELEQEVKTLKENLREMKATLAEIRRLLKEKK